MVIKSTVTWTCVGKEKFNDEDCRWIEFVSEIKDPNSDTDKIMATAIFKGLVPEKWLKDGNSPSGHWVKGYMKLNNDEAKTVGMDELTSPKSNFNIMFISPNPKAKIAEKKTIDTTLGKLACDGFANEIKFKGGNLAAVNTENVKGMFLTMNVTIKTQHYFHEKSPFGLVAAYSNISPNNVEDESILVEVGSGGKSEIPTPSTK